MCAIQFRFFAIHLFIPGQATGDIRTNTLNERFPGTVNAPSPRSRRPPFCRFIQTSRGQTPALIQTKRFLWPSLVLTGTNLEVVRSPSMMSNSAQHPSGAGDSLVVLRQGRAPKARIVPVPNPTIQSSRASLSGGLSHLPVTWAG